MKKIHTPDTVGKKNAGQAGGLQSVPPPGPAPAQREQEDRERRAAIARATERSPKQENL